MYENPYASSLDSKVLSATPLELVNLLYQAAIEAVQTARQHLTRGEIVERGRSVGRAIEFLTELSASLDHDKGGELSTRLAALYDYLQRTLLDANFRQADEGLAQVETLLKTLNEAWSAIGVQPSRASMEPHPAAYRSARTPDTSEEYASRATQQWCA